MITVMSSERRRPLSRTQPDGTRTDGMDGSTILAEREVLLSLRAALDAILSSSHAPEGIDVEEGSILGTSDATVSAVAHVVRRAHEALHQDTNPSDVKKKRCAEVLLTALPESVSRRLIFADALAQVRFLARQPVPERAIAPATAALLGWTEIAAGAVARAVELVVSRAGK